LNEPSTIAVLLLHIRELPQPEDCKFCILPKHIPRDIQKEGRDEEKCENDVPPEKKQNHQPHFFQNS
jgi:hypothetical protein